MKQNLDYDMENEKRAEPVQGNETPTPVKWTENFEFDGMADCAYTNHYATCPTCDGYPLYDRNPCPYCGQALIVEYPPHARQDKRKTVWKGTKETKDGKRVCANCGGTEVEMIGHMDAKDWYGSDYKCKGCGAKISCTTPRQKKGAYIF